MGTEPRESVLYASVECFLENGAKYRRFARSIGWHPESFSYLSETGARVSAPTLVLVPESDVTTRNPIVEEVDRRAPSPLSKSSAIRESIPETEPLSSTMSEYNGAFLRAVPDEAAHMSTVSSLPADDGGLFRTKSEGHPPNAWPSPVTESASDSLAYAVSQGSPNAADHVSNAADHVSRTRFEMKPLFEGSYNCGHRVVCSLSECPSLRPHVSEVLALMRETEGETFSLSLKDELVVTRCFFDSKLQEPRVIFSTDLIIRKSMVDRLRTRKRGLAAILTAEASAKPLTFGQCLGLYFATRELGVSRAYKTVPTGSTGGFEFPELDLASEFKRCTSSQCKLVNGELVATSSFRGMVSDWVDDVMRNAEISGETSTLPYGTGELLCWLIFAAHWDSYKSLKDDSVLLMEEVATVAVKLLSEWSPAVCRIDRLSTLIWEITGHVFHSGDIEVLRSASGPRRCGLIFDIIGAYHALVLMQLATDSAKCQVAIDVSDALWFVAVLTWCVSDRSDVSQLVPVLHWRTSLNDARTSLNEAKSSNATLHGSNQNTRRDELSSELGGLKSISELVFSIFSQACDALSSFYGIELEEIDSSCSSSDGFSFTLGARVKLTSIVFRSLVDPFSVGTVYKSPGAIRTIVSQDDAASAQLSRLYLSMFESVSRADGKDFSSGIAALLSPLSVSAIDCVARLETARSEVSSKFLSWADIETAFSVLGNRMAERSLGRSVVQSESVDPVTLSASNVHGQHMRTLFMVTCACGYFSSCEWTDSFFQRSVEPLLESLSRAVKVLESAPSSQQPSRVLKQALSAELAVSPELESLKSLLSDSLKHWPKTRQSVTNLYIPCLNFVNNKLASSSPISRSDMQEIVIRVGASLLALLSHIGGRIPFSDLSANRPSIGKWKIDSYAAIANLHMTNAILCDRFTGGSLAKHAKEALDSMSVVMQNRRAIPGTESFVVDHASMETWAARATVTFALAKGSSREESIRVLARTMLKFDIAHPPANEFALDFACTLLRSLVVSDSTDSTTKQLYAKCLRAKKGDELSDLSELWNDMLHKV